MMAYTLHKLDGDDLFGRDIHSQYAVLKGELVHSLLVKICAIYLRYAVAEGCVQGLRLV